MDQNVLIVIPVTSPVLVSLQTMFSIRCLMFMQVLSVTFVTARMTIDCMLPRRREKFKTKMTISSTYVVHFL